MSKERRYNEKEIADIFKQAAKDFEAAQQQVHASDGLTLKEIEEIAKETGISPDFVKRAASKVDLRRNSPTEKRIAGLPFQINRVVDLPEDFDRDDWDQLVAELHDAYGVVGTVQEQRDGRARSWASENVQVYLEPTGSGSRLRIISSNGFDTLMLLFGSIFFLVSMMFMAILVAKGNFMTQMDDTLLMFILAFSGLGVGGFGASRLPGWHRKEEHRIDSILSRLLTTAEEGLDAQNTDGTVKLDLGDVISPGEVAAEGEKSQTNARRQMRAK